MRRYLIPGLLYAIAYEIVGDEVVILAVVVDGILGGTRIWYQRSSPVH